MKRLTFAIAALATLALAAPTLASAEENGVHAGGGHGEMRRDGDRGGIRVAMPGERHHDRDWRNHRAESLVVIRHRRHHHHD